MKNKPSTYEIIFKRNKKNSLPLIVDSAEIFAEAEELLQFYCTITRFMGLRVVPDLINNYVVYTNDHEELGEYCIRVT